VTASDRLIVFVGKPNVGKSTLFSLLFGVKVRKGKNPGSTIKPNFFRTKKFTAVDLPGYGYMKGLDWEFSEMVRDYTIRYIEDNAELIVLAIHVIDISSFRKIVEKWTSRGELPVDLEMCDFLKEVCENVVVAANKSEKLGNNLALEVDYAERKLKTEVIPISAKKNNVKSIKSKIIEVLKKS
jgi:GTP-binding protein EngB required for normal cell division